MATYTQSERPLEITTPLGKDVLLLTRFKGGETISRPFHFELEMLASAKADVKFEKILGQAVTIRVDLTNGAKRYFNGIVTKFSQAGRNDRGFGRFRAEIRPFLWTLSKKVRSRTFQHLSVPEILRQVLVGFEVSFRLIGVYPRRDYCVQYRESDFNFASRLMEEEGISYLFEHANGSHTMIVTDHLNLMVEGQSTITYDGEQGAVADEMRITEWEKIQELRHAEFTLWDHCFELPGNHLEATRKLTQVVNVGTVPHRLRIPANEHWEFYDYPGAYAQRFDGIDSAGTPQPQGIQDIFDDRSRAVKIRMQQEETASLDIHGESYCGNFSAGHKFDLKRHFDADGEYLLTQVEHEAALEDYQSGDVPPFTYSNRFHCLPATVNFRPQPVTEKPVIAGVQTATVVGPPGEEIFVDKYGRVKVQFHWDREGKKDASSSCWLRVSQFWAGKGWGAFFWPRIGHEVVVVFEEGDPDQPLVIGSVYNAENMPFFKLPFCKDFAGVKSESCRGNQHQHYNGIVLVDRHGQEHLSIHSERHLVFNAEYDVQYKTGRHHGERVPVGRTATVGRIPGLDGGGSGGGISPPMTPPQPQGILGLNSVFVYGANAQVATPINFQMALGSNLQLCINPSGLANLVSSPAPALPQALAAMGGSGLGGNMQFTLGTSANFVIGQSYDINIGPARITVDTHDSNPANVPAIIIAWTLTAICVVFAVGYETIHGDAERAMAVAMCVELIQILLMVLMVVQDLTNTGDDLQHRTYTSMFRGGVPGISVGQVLHVAYGVLALLSAFVMIPIMAELGIASGESDLEHSENQAQADKDENKAREEAQNTFTGQAPDHDIPSD